MRAARSGVAVDCGDGSGKSDAAPADVFQSGSWQGIPAAGLMRSSCAAGFDGRAELRSALAGEILAIWALQAFTAFPKTGTGRAQAVTTKSFPTALGAAR